MSQDSHSPNNVAHQLVDAYYGRLEPHCLSQGDLISCDKLRKAIHDAYGVDPATELYPYFFKNYSSGVILNADCDIFAKESRRPKVKCVQIAAVVEGSAHIKNLLLQVSKKDHYLTRVIDEKTYRDVVKKFERLINNQEKIYFYLPENLNIGFKSAHLVRLDTSISIHVTHPNEDEARKKYNILVDSRFATLKEPYKSKLGESFASLFDRTGLADVKDQLDEDYEPWIQNEMRKYFITIDDVVYRQARSEIKKLAEAVGAETSEYATQLPEILKKHASGTREEFDNLPAYGALKKIISNRMKDPEGVIKNIASDPDIANAFRELQAFGNIDRDEGEG